MNTKCVVCKTELSQDMATSSGDIKHIDCPLCGKYKISRSLHDDLDSTYVKNELDRVKLSHFIRRAQGHNDHPYLNTYLVESILQQSLPSITEQADILLTWVGENIYGPGLYELIKTIPHQYIVGAVSSAGLEFVIEYLVEKELVKLKQGSESIIAAGVPLTLTYKGWERLDKILRGTTDSMNAFMAMKFGDADLDSIVKDVFVPSVRDAGFNLKRLDDNPKAGLIDNKMRVDIRASRFMVADLTHDNLGSYWEAGYAEGLGKPVIYTCSKEKFESAKTHFDTNHHLTILWDKNNLSQAAEDLKATIRATLPSIAKLEDTDI